MYIFKYWTITNVCGIWDILYMLNKLREGALKRNLKDFNYRQLMSLKIKTEFVLKHKEYWKASVCSFVLAYLADFSWLLLSHMESLIRQWALGPTSAGGPFFLCANAEDTWDFKKLLHHRYQKLPANTLLLCSISAQG